MSSLSFRYLRQRPGRTALTVAGVALGVATFFTATTTTASVNRGLDRLVEGYGGRAQVVALAVGGFDAVAPAGAAERLAHVEGVAASTNVVTFASAFRSSAEGAPRVVESRYGGLDLGAPRVLGVDHDDASALYDFELAAGRFFQPSAGEAIVPRALAADLAVGVGDRIEVATPSGPRSLAVVGLLTDDGVSRYNQGQVVLTSIETARGFAGAADGVSLVPVRLEPGVDPPTWIRAHGDEIGDRFSLLEVGDLAAPIKAVASSFGSGLGGLGMVVLFVAALLISLTLGTAVAERSQTIGVLRALGAGRRAIARLVVVEALVLGVASTALGLALGQVLGRLVLAQVGGATNPIPTTGLVLNAVTVGGSVLLGVGVSAGAALVPARRAARVDPIEAIRRTPPPPQRAATAWLPGAILLGGGIVATAVLRGGSSGIAAFPVLLGAVLLVPRVLPGLARLIGAVTTRRTTVGVLVVPHLARQRARAAATVALAMVVMAMTTALGAIATSFNDTARRQVEAQFGADVQLTAAAGIDDRTVDSVLDVPGVQAVARKWMGWTEVSEAGVAQRTRFWAVDPEAYFRVSRFAWAEGSDEAAARAFSAGGAVALPEALAQRLGVEPGDRVTLDTTSGAQRFEVIGTFTAFGSSRSADAFAAIAVGIGDGTALLGAVHPLALDVGLDRGVDPRDVAATIEDRLGAEGGFVVRTADQTKEFILDRVGELTTALGLIIGTSAAVSAFGLANTLAVSMLERRREIGVLRAVGVYRRQVRRMAMFEAAALVSVAAVLAIPLGSLVSRPMVEALSASAGNVVRYVYPWRWLGTVAVLAVIIAVAAAVVPARRAARMDVAAALQFE